MPILMDLSNVMVSNLMAQLGSHTNAQVDEPMLRHMVLNSIRANRKTFHQKYGELVICADGNRYWRKDVFPYYKAMRKANREKSELDWNAIFVALNNIRDEIGEFFPYKVIRVENAEADDVIASIGMKYGQQLAVGEPFLVLSSDKDMSQLQKFANIDQYDPVRKKWIKNSTPERSLFEHIVRGDSGDGVPNILSADDTFVSAARQKPIRSTQIDAWFVDPSKMSEEVKRNFMRNKSLIDFELIPNHIQTQAITQYEHNKGVGRGKLLDYFIKNRLRNLMENISEF